jgi:quercetin dioxygenase-like cupin family protein
MQRRNSMWVMLVSAVILFTALNHARKALATPASGFVGTTIALGRLEQFEVFNHFIPANTKMNDDDRKIWLSWQKTRGSSDLYVQNNVWQAGGTTGWHSHPGHSLIIVTAGTITDYEANDPACTPHVYTAGQAFVDEGGSHAHIIRNEGSVIAQSIAVQLIPAGQPRRIDVPTAPGNCSF